MLIEGLPKKSSIAGISDANFIVSARKLASFTGQIISMAPVSGNISRIITIHCVMSALRTQHWDVEVGLDQYCIAKVHFWRANLDSFKVRDCFLPKKPQRFVYFDAIATGCGSVVPLNEDQICHRLWEPSECLKSSTRRELAAIDFTLESFSPIFGGFAC